MFLQKTFKREIALALICALIFLAVFAMFGADAAVIAARASIVNALALPILAFAAAAFGMDWVAKQTNWGGPPTPLESQAEWRQDYAG